MWLDLILNGPYCFIFRDRIDKEQTNKTHNNAWREETYLSGWWILVVMIWIAMFRYLLNCFLG
jgi:hypothetical protein